MLRKHALLVFALVLASVTTFVCRKNQPPDRPGLPSGRNVGRVDSTYNFLFTVTDPDLHDELQMLVDWDDSSSSLWMTVPTPGEQVMVDHAWQSPGDYGIRVKTRDRAGRESEWSDARAVHMAPYFPNRVVDQFYLEEEELKFCVALADDEFIYIGNCSRSAIMVTSTIPFYSTHLIPVGNPGDEPDMTFALTPDARHVYVACDHLGKVMVVRTEDHTLVDSILFENHPGALAVHPSGEFAYVLQWTEQEQLLVLRIRDNAIIDRVTVGHRPSRNVEFSPDGAYAYLTGEDENKVWVVRASDHTVVDSVSVPQEPAHLTVTPDGRYIFVVSTWNSILTRLRTSDLAVLDTVELGMNGRTVGALPNSEYVYVPAGDYEEETRAWVVRTRDFAVVDSVPLPPGPSSVYGMAASAAGDYVYIPLRNGMVAKLGF